MDKTTQNANVALAKLISLAWLSKYVNENCRIVSQKLSDKTKIYSC